MHLTSFCSVLLIAMATVRLATAQPKFFADTFDNNALQWPFVGDENGYNISIQNGHLTIHSTQSAIHTYINAALGKEIDFALYGRFILRQGDHKGWMGLRFAMSENAAEYCSFVYNNDKSFLISTSTEKKYEVIRESKSQLVKPFDYNSLTVIKSGNDYRFLINDKQVHAIKIKSFFGPMIAVMTNSSMNIQVDEVELYDPSKDRILHTPGSASQFANSAPNDAPFGTPAEITNPDFREFLAQFPQLPSPYRFRPESAEGVDVSSLPFTQQTFYRYVATGVRNKSMWAIGRLSECGKGYALLMLNRYLINQQDVSRFLVVAFDTEGNIVSEKEIGSMVKENGNFFKVLDFKTYRDGNVVNVEATETFSNGNKLQNSVRFHTALCSF